MSVAKWTSLAVTAAALALAACGGGGTAGSGSGGNAGAGARSHPKHPPSSHRAVAALCPRDRDPAGSLPGSSQRDGAVGTCIADAECTSGINGRCLFAGCSYDGCFTDEDCGGSTQAGSGGACICAAPGLNRAGHGCISGNCRIDADCGPNGYCSENDVFERCGGVIEQALYCHTSQDTCVDDTDCGVEERCVYQQDATRWACEAVPPCSG